ncbi:ankyrin repeat domain-containing protein [Marinobacter litoralis]|uniref:ankyrin repeat domain-containing protein n=1 Tax=Marinobacter litoralis TaxID=187981 RepID=UPI0018ED978E|nr:ankyrin repeat domain-containing protein [Marinobacter litoralis]MBJ6136988.1 ankyrin repeat domain-containing protein [Marinobacter litoralis]
MVETQAPKVTSVDSVALVSKRFEAGELTVIELGGLLQDNVNDEEFLLSPGFARLVGVYVQSLAAQTEKFDQLSDDEQHAIEHLNRAKVNLVGPLMFGNDVGGCVMAKVLSDEAKRKLDLGKVIAYRGSPACYQHFKQKGVPWPESAKMSGIGPLHMAVKYNNRRMVTWLIQQNPDLLNRQDKEGRRPLLYSQDDAMVKFLLKHGATPPEEWDK